MSLAALGRFGEAVRYAVDAIQLAGGREAPGFEGRQNRLALFLESQPYLEEPGPAPEAPMGE